MKTFGYLETFKIILRPKGYLPLEFNFAYRPDTNDILQALTDPLAIADQLIGNTDMCRKNIQLCKEAIIKYGLPILAEGVAIYCTQWGNPTEGTTRMEHLRGYTLSDRIKHLVNK